MTTLRVTAPTFAADRDAIKRVHEALLDAKRLAQEAATTCRSQEAFDCFGEIINGIDDLRHDSSIEAYAGRLS